jgi:hypothetical protein
MLVNVKILKYILILSSVFCIYEIFTAPINSLPCGDLVNFGPLFQLCTTSTWKEFLSNDAVSEINQKKWAWVGLITMKSKIPLKLKTLNLHWLGKKIDSLQASLYQKKETDPQLIPIQHNLVCDGTWDSIKQELSFNVDQKVVAINSYYLVLSFPKQEEKTIKTGQFSFQNKKSIHLTKMD